MARVGLVICRTDGCGIHQLDGGISRDGYAGASSLDDRFPSRRPRLYGDLPCRECSRDQGCLLSGVPLRELCPPRQRHQLCRRPRYRVIFTRNVTACSYQATIGGPVDTLQAQGVIGVTQLPGNPNGVLISTAELSGHLGSELPSQRDVPSTGRDLGDRDHRPTERHSPKIRHRPERVCQAQAREEAQARRDDPIRRRWLARAL